jgi:hypothetical protein
MRSSIGDDVSADAASLANQIVNESVSVATAAGHLLKDGEVAKVRDYVTQAGSTSRSRCCATSRTFRRKKRISYWPHDAEGVIVLGA